MKLIVDFITFLKRLKHFNSNLDYFSIIMPDDWNFIKINKEGKNIFIFTKIDKQFKLLELTDEEIKIKRGKVKKAIHKKVVMPIQKRNYNELSPEDWKPKHIVQYIKFKFTTIYGFIPLELKWKSRGYISNAKDRAKCWAYAKHLIDRFNRAKIAKTRLKHYIDWVFQVKVNTIPSMGLLSCNNYIDEYKFKQSRKRLDAVRNGYIEDNKVWDKQVKLLEKENK